MHFDTQTYTSQSLAEAPVGQWVMVCEIIFDAVRDACNEHDVCAGDFVCCEARDSQNLHVRSSGGRRFHIDRHLATFVAIERSAACHTPMTAGVGLS